MFSVIVFLTAGVPAFAPAPVWTESKRTYADGDVEGARDNVHERIITLSRDGKQKVYEVARDAKVTINGQKGYTFDDLIHGCSLTNRVMLTIKDGHAVALDVTYPLRKGEKLWRPGMSPGQLLNREAKEGFRQLEERIREERRRLGIQ